MAQKNKPAHEIRLGKIRVTIWANASANHEAWFSVSIARIYQDETQWKEATSFRRDDLPIVSKAVDMAYAWIWSRQTAGDEAYES